MDEEFGAAQCQHAGDFGIEYFFGRDSGDPAQRGVGDREYAVEAVAIEIGLPHIVRARRKHRQQPAVSQHDIAIGRDQEACLEIKAREMWVGLIGIAGDMDAKPLRQCAERVIFGSVRSKADTRRKPFDRLSGGV